MTRRKAKEHPFPKRRVREAGLTGGETPQRDRITADDLSPETLLDEEGDHDAADQRGPVAPETQLTVSRAPGMGGGADEAEDAQRQPISRAEHSRIKRRVARSGGRITNLEPNETRAGSPGRRRNSRSS